jgi:hypothetical protein
MRVRNEAAQTGVDTRRTTEGPGGVLDSTSRSTKKNNAADMPGFAAVLETSRMLRVKYIPKSFEVYRLEFGVFKNSKYWLQT